MLVLTRKEDQKILFPALGISLQVVRIKGSSVRLGIDAPEEVRIVRDELDFDPLDTDPQFSAFRLPQNLRHELRNQLNSLNIALHLFQQQLAAGFCDDAEATFEKLVECVGQLSDNSVFSSEGVPLDEQPAMTALLVEDEPNEREMLAGFLRLQGYQVATAGDGLEAIDYLESNEKPAVVLVDMRMPRCDGPTTIRRIRENPAFDRVKVFAISGSTPEENQMRADDERVNAWFMKPLNPESLVDTMKAVAAEPESAAA